MRTFEEDVKTTHNRKEPAAEIDSGLPGDSLMPPVMEWESGEIDMSMANNSTQDIHQLKSTKQEIPYTKQIKTKLRSAYRSLLIQRAKIRRKNFEAANPYFTDSFTTTLDQFLTKSGELLKARELNEKYVDDSAKDQTEFLKKYHAMAGKFSHSVALLNSILVSSGDSIDNSIDRFERFLAFMGDFVPDVPIVSHYLKFILDGGTKILGAIKKIKAQIADLNALSRHITGDDYKPISRASGLQPTFEYVNHSFQIKDANAMTQVPENVKAYIYENEDKFKLDLPTYKNELPADDSINPFVWTTYDEKALRKWIFKNREALYEKFTGSRKYG